MAHILLSGVLPHRPSIVELVALLFHHFGTMHMHIFGLNGFGESFGWRIQDLTEAGGMGEWTNLTGVTAALSPGLHSDENQEAN